VFKLWTHQKIEIEISVVVVSETYSCCYFKHHVVQEILIQDKSAAKKWTKLV